MTPFKTERTSVTVFGIKVAEVERTSELFSQAGGRERIIDRPSASSLSIDPTYLTPLLVETFTGLHVIVPDMISFGEGQLLEVDGNVDADTACEYLKTEKHLTREDAKKIVFGLGAKTDLYESRNRELAGAFRSQSDAAVEKHWPQK